MEAVRHLLDRTDVDVGGKRVVDPVAQHRRRHVGIDVQVRDLRERVHAGIGPPRSIQLELASSGHVLDRTFEFPGYRPRVFLDLPATVFRAGVLDDQLEPRHIRFGNLEM
jgi:hypothetical protein